MTTPRKSKEQVAAERRARARLKERDRIGLVRFEVLELKRQAARIERCRARTAAAVAARRAREQQPEMSPFEEIE